MARGIGARSRIALIVLALDLSKRATGWACGDGTRWHHGTLKCPYEPPAELSQNDISADYSGSVADWHRRLIFQLIENHKPEYAAIEKPLPSNLVEKKRFIKNDAGAFGQSLISVPMPATSFGSLFALYGLAFQTAGLLHRKSIPCHFVAAQTWRKAIGVGQPPKTEKDRSRWYKRECIRVLSLRGIDVSSPDAAEAVGIGICLLGQLNQSVRIGALL